MWFLRYEGECEEEKCLANWMRVDSLTPTWEYDSLESQGLGSDFLKLWSEFFLFDVNTLWRYIEDRIQEMFWRKREEGNNFKNINEDLDHDFILKINLILIFSL